MRRLLGVVVLLAGCASSSEFVSGPGSRRLTNLPATIPPACAAPGSGPCVDPYAAQRATPIRESPATRITRWLKSGRGWTWGAADHDPVRDRDLDRLMVDTLTSSQPAASREPA